MFTDSLVTIMELQGEWKRRAITVNVLVINVSQSLSGMRKCVVWIKPTQI